MSVSKAKLAKPADSNVLALFNYRCSPPEMVMCFKENKVLFFHHIILEQIQRDGISIPPGQEKEYEGRNFIALPSESSKAIDIQLFKKAFISVYWPTHLSKYKFVSILETPGTSSKPGPVEKKS